MKIQFSKYQGTGNDFIMLNNLDGQYDILSVDQVKHLCDRRFGIGADGLIKINSSQKADFEVDYYNSDGSKSFCGNGARCSVAFAQRIGLQVENARFDAIDGMHTAQKTTDVVSLEMLDVSSYEIAGFDYVIYTGSPHYIRFVEDVMKQDVVKIGKTIRYSPAYEREGINVNIVSSQTDGSLFVRTYERGVEDETLSCGTGVTACVLAYAVREHKIGQHQVIVKTLGGNLSVAFEQYTSGKFRSVRLIGSAEFVFSGEIDV